MNMKTLNNSHYFTPYSKLYTEFIDTNSFEYESSRRNGFFQRLYFEHLYTLSVGGQDFFYTLTYNDKSLPTFLGFPCFKYSDLREVTYGYLPNHLLRDYGSRLRFFVSCETGEGKGCRGLGKNPHYHIIFFIQPANNPKYVYKKINPKEFRSLVRYCWQGAEKIKFQDAKFGICKEGKNFGLIDSSTSADCFHYCAKYVIKDTSQIATENEIYQAICKRITDEGFSLNVLHYFMSKEAELDPDYSYDDFNSLVSYDSYLVHCDNPTLSLDHKDFLYWLCHYVKNFALFDDFQNWYYEWYIPEMYKIGVQEYKNLFSGKPRMSKSLGEYGIKFITDVNSAPRIVIPNSDKHEFQYPCLYYIRKLYYTPVKCEVTGNILYRLNALGRTLKLNRLDTQIRDKFSKVKECLSLHYKFDKVVTSDPLDSCCDWLHPGHHFSNTGIIVSDINNIFSDECIRRYCVYDIIYRHRFFDVFDININLDTNCSPDSYRSDYRFFLEDGLYSIDFDSGFIFDYIKKQTSCVSYSSHLAFADYRLEFAQLDTIVSIWSRSLSEGKRSEYNSKAAHIKRIKAVQND